MTPVLKTITDFIAVVLIFQLLEKNPKHRLCSLESYKNHPFNSSLSFEDVLEKRVGWSRLLKQLQTGPRTSHTSLR